MEGLLADRRRRLGLACHFGFGLGDGAAYGMFVGEGHDRGGGEC